MCDPSSLDGLIGYLVYSRKIDVHTATILLEGAENRSVILFTTTCRKLAIQTKILILACAGGIESRIRIRKV